MTATDWENFREKIKIYDKEWHLRFALWCVKKVVHLYKQNAGRERLERHICYVESYLEPPSEKLNVRAGVPLSNFFKSNNDRAVWWAAANAAMAANTEDGFLEYTENAVYWVASVLEGVSADDLLEEYNPPQLNTISLKELNRGL